MGQTDKPDAKTPRHGSWAVFDALKTFCSFGSNVILEYTSSDGFFVDITQEINNRIEDEQCVQLDKNVFVEGSELRRNNPRQFFKRNTENDTFRLICGAAYLTQMAASLLGETGMECSAGVSSNKLVAKMACTLHKPAGITILPLSGFNSVRHKIAIRDITGFGRDNGDLVKNLLGITNLQELSKVSLRDLEMTVGNNNMARKLYHGARGICYEPVYVNDLHKNVSCGKSFQNCRMDLQRVMINVENRAGEMEERLAEEKNRHKRVTDSLQIKIDFRRNNGMLKRSFTFMISSDPNHHSRRQLPQQLLRIIRTFPGVSFNPTMEITKMTLTASKWTSTLPLSIQNGTTHSPDAERHFVNCCFVAIAEEEPTRQVYQLRISLDKVNPKIWRVIQVPEHFTFYQLHKAIQDSMGWENYMSHEFVVGRAIDHQFVCVGAPNEFFDGIKHIFAEKGTPMTMFLAEVGDQVIYQHGFEEEWPHTVVLEEILPAVRGRDYPCCIDGKRAAPPDDVDLFSYTELLETFKHPEELQELHEDGFYLNYDPDKFNPDDVVFNDVVDWFDEGDEN